jgi:uncharacterized membrane protein (UPF0127 family)
VITGRARRRRLASADERLAGLRVIALPGGLRVHVAGSWAERRDGLAGLPALSPASGLWIAPCRSIHTIGMRFVLDLVWLDAGLRVVAVDAGVGPRRQRTSRRARSVLETAAGQGQRFADAWPARAAVEDAVPS